VGDPLAVFILYLTIIIIFVVIPLVLIVRKAGFSGWWVLLWFVPLLNIVMLWVFAVIEWPVMRRSLAEHVS
jgi:hypothetical protein